MSASQSRLERLRERWRARSRKQRPPPHQLTRVDVWLTRAASIAQAGVLLATIVGFYYTVIPLYQKAALDELIARREIELKEAQASILVAKREAYEQRRANFTSAIEFAAVDCSDVRTSFRQPAPNFNDAGALRADHERRIRLNVEVTPCLASVLTKYEVAKRLTELDARHIGSVFAALGEQIDRQRIEAAARVADMPNLAARDPTILVLVGPSVQHLDEVRAEQRKRLAEIGMRLPALEENARERFQYRVQITQSQMANDYRRNASQAIREAVRGIQWPREAALAPTAPVQ